MLLYRAGVLLDLAVYDLNYKVVNGLYIFLYLIWVHTVCL